MRFQPTRLSLSLAPLSPMLQAEVKQLAKAGKLDEIRARFGEVWYNKAVAAVQKVKQRSIM